MSPEKQRIAIAEACGWVPQKQGSALWLFDGGKKWADKDHLPDFLSDLNAMHEAIRDVIAGNQELEVRFIKELHAIQDDVADSEDVTPICEHEMVDIIISECWWLAKAFLRTTNKWEDE